MSVRCACTTRHLVHLDGAPESLEILEQLEDRDICWLRLPVGNTSAAVPISGHLPVSGDRVVALLASGRAHATVRGLVHRDGDAMSAIELQLDCIFEPGDSGSVIVNSCEEIVAVVRTNTGRCGLLPVHS